MTKTKIELLTVNQVIAINKLIVEQENQKHLCADSRKVESAVHAALYPGSYPFQHGGIACVAGALCYFLTKAHAFFDGNKRTAGIVAVTFMDINGYSLQYPFDVKTGLNEFADVIEQVATNEISKDKLIEWFDIHKFHDGK
ncbi:MAG TPA: type II toxin-antitoxin system death-on-curing family toxin [Candidatus Babeliales bacterium]|nr:type II toxin-antitoxin system death-on-curing family toxin [Candidatus Babeliales bacterium]